MSSFGGSGFGFGQNNQQSGGFGGGGFGSNTNTTTGFGGNTANNTAFGSSNTNTTGGLFGSNTGGGFGSTGGAFGSTNNSFAAKPAFGSSTTTGGGGLFGSSNANTASNTFGGGFGTTSNNAFGSSNTAATSTTGGLFGGANKSGFGATNTGSSLFGGNTTGGFGGSTTGPFGAPNNPGIGANLGDPPGTAGTTFQPFVEKESTGATSNFQNILFQDAYKKWSPEELRLADYAQGRRHGNPSGAGAFGVSSGFGFGGNNNANSQTSTFGNSATGSSLFGPTAANNTTPGFAQTGTGTSSFGGGSTTGGIFGNKPAATGGIFGTNTGQSGSTGLFSQSTGGFGTNTNTGGGFGSAPGTTSGGIFGASATSNQKPGGFSFGQPASTGGFGSTGTNTSFGANTAANTTTSGGIFGNPGQSSGGGGIFGNTNPQPAAGTSSFAGQGFGSQNQQASSGIFGNSQAKPAGGLFAPVSTGTGGIFGNAQSSTTPFGGNNAISTTNNIFGGNKPATTGTSLFGPTNTTQVTGTSGSIFGGLGSNTQPQQTGQTSMFGGLGQTQQKPSLFTTSTAQPATTSIFGNPPAQQQTSIFGGSTQQQPQNSILGGSMLGGSLGMGSTPQSLTTSIGDVSAYGTPSLFSNLGGNETANPGPLATPLGSKSKPRRSSILPMYKLNPASASRFVTPQKRGFGFSYSTFGSPSSPASAASTPGGFGRSLLGPGSLGRSLNKSVSTNSLRRTFNTDESILAPGAFSASSGARYYGNNGSVKKLVINRDMRSDLFSTPQKDKAMLEMPNGSGKKRVSWEEDLESNKAVNDDVSVRTPNGSGDVNGTRAVLANSTPESDKPKGKELAVVEEEPSQAPRPNASDKELGDYYMSPTLEEIESMSRQQREKVSGFTVGMVNIGWVRFKVPVDLTEPSVKLEDLFGKIVQFRVRSATVYPDVTKKPPVGKGLNVPAIISLQHSGPRGGQNTPGKIDKHIGRLKQVPDTTFISFDVNTMTWTFSVEHFTTYGLDDDDESDVDPPSARASGQTEHSNSRLSAGELGPDDTFDFRRKALTVPGAFDMEDAGDASDGEEMFELAGRGSGLNKLGSSREVMPSTEVDLEGDADSEMYDEYDGAGYTAEDNVSTEEENERSVIGSESPIPETPGGILRARMRALKSTANPAKLQIADGDDWTAVLQKSVNGARPDRAALKAMNEEAVANKDANQTGKAVTEARAVADGRGFATSIDLMNSLFGKPKLSADLVQPKGSLKWPHDRRTNMHSDAKDDGVGGFRHPVRPSWGPNGQLVLATNRPSVRGGAFVVIHKTAIRSQEQCLQMGSLKYESPTKGLRELLPSPDGRQGLLKNIPDVRFKKLLLASRLHGEDRDGAADMNTPEVVEEALLWRLVSILFGEVAPEPGMPEHAVRRANLSRFWEDLVDKSAVKATSFAKTPEERAVAALSGHRIPEACKHLLDGKNFRLAALVALVNTSETAKKDMRAQLREWREANVLSEFDDSIRAIYEVLGGNVCVCEGKKNVPVEDRVDSFVVSERFGLDWKRAFGLRLWYSLPPGEDISAAIKQFAEDIDQDREQRPLPWYLTGTKAGPEPAGNKTEHMMWGLLKLYVDGLADLETVLQPTNWGRNPFDMRLSWQLGRVLLETGRVSYGSRGAERADAATISYASQLTSGDNWVIALIVLGFLSDAKARNKAIQEHLSRHGPMLRSMDDEEGSNEWLLLAMKGLGVHESCVPEAQALFLRTVQQHPEQEIGYLLRARQPREAHRRLVEQVAPAAIISRDYRPLLALLEEFEGLEKEIPEWDTGARMFKSFLAVSAAKGTKRPSEDADLSALLAGFRGTTESRLFNGNVLFRAAIMEMAAQTGARLMDAWSPETDYNEANKVLGLPLTSDARLRLATRYSELLGGVASG